MMRTLYKYSFFIALAMFLAAFWGLTDAQASSPVVGQVSVTRTGSGATAETVVMPVVEIGSASISSCEFSLDGGFTWTSGGAANFKNLSGGQYCEFTGINLSALSNPDLIRVRAINSDSSLATNPLPVIVDGTAPQVTIQSPLADSSNDDKPSLVVKTNETAACQHKIDDGVFVPITGTGGLLHAYDYADIPQGEHTVSVECTDPVGNKASKQVAFVVAPLFKDIAGHWAQEYIALLKKKCVGVEGYRAADGTLLYEFRPNNFMSRAELVTVLVRCTYGVQSSSSEVTFPDVETSAYYSGYVQKAKELGWISGYGDGTFRPANPVTRAEALKIILLSQYADSDISESDTIIGFVDVLPGWYRKFVFFAVANGFVEGYKDASGNLTGMFKPENNVTRAEVAKIVALVKGWGMK